MYGDKDVWLIGTIPPMIFSIKLPGVADSSGAAWEMPLAMIFMLV